MIDAAPAANGGYTFGQFHLLPGQRALLENGQPVRLGSRALEILVLLVERAGEVLTKEELIHRVWPGTVIDEAGLRVHIAALRKALGEGRSGLRYVANVPLRGYCFVVPVTRHGPALPASGTLPGLPAGAAPVSLPPRVSRLLGRDDAIAAVIDTLQKRQFVTLVGPGGIGKTSVALAAADGLQAGYPQGICFVDFATLSDAALVPSAIATALGVPLQTDNPTRELAAWLRQRRMLLILDNCEHVVEAATAVSEALLGSAPGLSVLATSREPLRARGEWVQRLTSLAGPPANTPTSYSRALAYPAFELFVERAMASVDSLVLGDADVPRIAHLCRSLDGIPLAIELVAARIAVFGLGGLVDRLDDHLSLPTIGHRTALPRQQGLRATLDWSHGLLSPHEQCLLRRLSVFRDRFALDAAGAIASDTTLSTSEVMQLLMTLVAKSLVSAEPGDGAVQYRLLETTRSYAAEKLAASGELAQTARRHALYCRTLLEAATADLETQIPARWRERHGRKVDEVRAALGWVFGAAGDAELGAELVANSAPLWFGLGVVNEYLQRLAHCVAHLPAALADGPLDMKLHLLLGQASLAIRGGVPEGLAALERSIALAGALGDLDCRLRGLWSSFSLYALRGDYVRALASARAYGEAAQASGDEVADLTHHRIMALCLHFTGEQAQALDHVEQALRPSSLGMRTAQGSLFHLDHRTASLTQRARILWLMGRPEQAQRAAHDAADAAMAVDHALSLAYALSYAACPVALWSGDLAAARGYIDELQRCTDEQSLVFWQSWPPLFRRVLALREGHPEGASALDEGSLHFSHVDMLATLHESFAGPAALARAEQGLNAWCAPEILRVRGEQLLASGPGHEAEGEAMLRRALAASQAQQALGWSLRCATSLARRLRQRGDAAEAADALTAVLARFREGEGTADVVAARALLAGFTTAAATTAR